MAQDSEERVRQGETSGRMRRVLTISIVVALVLVVVGILYTQLTPTAEVPEPPVAEDVPETTAPATAPAEDATPAPAEDASPAPTETPAPAPAETPAPAEDATEAPAETPAPAEDATEAPAEETTPAPAN